jgi:hypothetical protein
MFLEACDCLECIDRGPAVTCYVRALPTIDFIETDCEVWFALADVMLSISTLVTTTARMQNET